MEQEIATRSKTQAALWLAARVLIAVAAVIWFGSQLLVNRNGEYHGGIALSAVLVAGVCVLLAVVAASLAKYTSSD